MKRLLTLLLFLSGLLHTYAQLTLEECQKDAQANYPLVRQYNLLELSENYSLANAAKGNLPQIALSGKVSYQSDATTLPFELPDIHFHGIPKDQYQVMMEVRQNIWDGGEIRKHRQQTEAASDEAEKKLDVSMYALREKVNQMYFGILLIDEHLKQNDLLYNELNRNLKDITAYCDNGIANNADINAVEVEILQNRQQRIGLENNRKAYLRMLSLLTGKDLSEKTRLTQPEMPESNAAAPVNRPELAWYAAQTYRLQVEQQHLRTGYMPRFSLFAQGAYGNPGLNLLKDKFGFYYVVGARMSWNFGSLYTLKNSRRELDIQRKEIASNRELFLLNTQLKLIETDENISTLKQQMKNDERIVRLRTNIRKAAEAKVANGTLSVTEMLRELANESLARENLSLHRIQLLKAIYERKHLTN